MILVTGATGNVGSELVPQLLERGQSVRVLTRDARKVAHLGERVQRAVGDFSKPDTLDAAMQGVEQAFLVTAEIGDEQVGNALAAAKRAGVRRFVYLSSMGAGSTAMRVGKWHHDREEAIRASGLGWTFLRPGMFMSNTLPWAETIRAQGAVYSAGGEGKTAPIDPRDIATVAAIALTQPGQDGKIYELTGSELLSAGEQVAILSRVLGKPIRYVDLPPSAAKEQMLQSGMNAELADALEELFTLVRNGRGAQALDTFEQVVGQKPRTFEMWCRDHVTAFQ